MALEDSAFNGQGLPFVSTIVCSDWKGTGRKARINAADYDPARDGEIVEGPTQPPVNMGKADAPNKDPRVNADGVAIYTLGSPMYRA